MTYTQVWDYIRNRASDQIIIRDLDQAHIPTDPDNIDYQIYLQFLEDGGVPTPYTPPSASKPAPETRKKP